MADSHQGTSCKSFGSPAALINFLRSSSEAETSLDFIELALFRSPPPFVLVAHYPPVNGLSRGDDFVESLLLDWTDAWSLLPRTLRFVRLNLTCLEALPLSSIVYRSGGQGIAETRQCVELYRRGCRGIFTYVFQRHTRNNRWTCQRDLIAYLIAPTCQYIKNGYHLIILPILLNGNCY